MGKFIYGYLMLLGDWKLPEDCELTLINNNLHAVLGFQVGKTFPEETIYLIPKIPDREDLDKSIDYFVPQLRSFFVSHEPRLWYIMCTT